jgi:hypothetical protein
LVIESPSGRLGYDEQGSAESRNPFEEGFAKPEDEPILPRLSSAARTHLFHGISMFLQKVSNILHVEGHDLLGTIFKFIQHESHII